MQESFEKNFNARAGDLYYRLTHLRKCFAGINELDHRKCDFPIFICLK